MKVDNKIVQSGTRVVQENVIWINFKDKAIDKLYIEKEQIVRRPPHDGLYLKKIKY